MSVENNKISIIGGSIAGLSCGIRIKQLAINKIKHVTLYEARVKGREKCCGGLLTQKAYNYLEEMLKADVLEQCVKSKVERFDIYENYTKLFSSTSYHPIRICDRAELDLALTNRFIELGGEYLDNIRVEQDTIEKLKYQNDIILDATGCNIKEGKNGFGIEYTLKRKTINDTSFERDDYLDIIQIHFGIIKRGYGWVFPFGKDMYKIGVATFEPAEVKKVKDIIEQFVNKVDIYGGEVIKKLGAYIPSEIDSQEITYNDMKCALIGDRSGYIDYITGEGIYYAISDGRHIGSTIALDNYNNDTYSKSEIRRNHDLSRKSYNTNKWFYNDFIRKYIIWNFVKRELRKNYDFLYQIYDKFVDEKSYKYDLDGIRRFIRWWKYIKKERKKIEVGGYYD